MARGLRQERMKATERAAKSSRSFGASHELHWHAIAAEWAYVIDGRCQTVVLDPSGASEINNFGPGDLWFFPKGPRSLDPDHRRLALPLHPLL